MKRTERYLRHIVKDGRNLCGSTGRWPEHMVTRDCQKCQEQQVRIQPYLYYIEKMGGRHVGLIHVDHLKDVIKELEKAQGIAKGTKVRIRSKTYDWDAIWDYREQGHTVKQTIIKFGCSKRTVEDITRFMKKKGKVITRFRRKYCIYRLSEDGQIMDEIESQFTKRMNDKEFAEYLNYRIVTLENYLKVKTCFKIGSWRKNGL